MLRPLFCIVMLLVIRFSFAQELSALQKIPNKIIPGTSYTSEITITKGAMNNFIKFSQKMPKGFIASAIDSRNGAFTFNDSIVKIVWIIPPVENEFTVSFKVSVPKDATGMKKVKGKVTYFFNVHRQFFYLEPQNILVVNDSITTVLTPKDTSLLISKDSAENTVKFIPKIHPTDTPHSSVSDTTANLIVLKASNLQKSAAGDSIKENLTAEKSTKKMGDTAQAQSSTNRMEIMQDIPVRTVSPTAKKTYRVQFGAFKTKPKIGGVAEVSNVLLDNGVTKYFSGNFADLEDAAQRKQEMIEKGFRGAFIVTFENGKMVGN